MSAAEKFTFQTRPTPEQRQAIAADHAKRYARQYRDVHDAVTDFQVARLRYEAECLSRQPEPCQFCAVEDEDETGLSLLTFSALGIGALGLWAGIGYVTWWLVGVFLGVKA